MFDKLVWQKDRMLLDDLVFRLAHDKDADWDLGDNCFEFFKIKVLTDQYAKFLSLRRDFRPENVFELGIWDGGSVAFWFECFRPKKHVAVDLATREDSSYFRRYVSSRGLANRIKTYWETDQEDSAKLKQIVAAEFSGPLDLVIDDASHLYGPTKASFETLFPLLRPGGYYLIEDWAWPLWEGFQAGPPGSELTKLVFELVEATGSTLASIADLAVFQGFVAVERSEVGTAELGAFKLEHHIYRQPTRSVLQRILNKLKG